MFVGVARHRRRRGLPSGVGHHRLDDLGPLWDGGTAGPGTMKGVGGGPPGTPPGEHDIWVAQSSGTGTQIVDWRPEDGDWTVVVMRADGDAGVDVAGAGGRDRSRGCPGSPVVCWPWVGCWRSSARCSSPWRCGARSSGRPRVRRRGGLRRRRGVRSSPVPPLPPPRPPPGTIDEVRAPRDRHRRFRGAGRRTPESSRGDRRGHAAMRRWIGPPPAVRAVTHGWARVRDLACRRGSSTARPGERRAAPQVERPLPEPGPGQVRVRVRCCGVCRTDLHLAEGDLPPRRPDVTPGHEVVGAVEALGPGADRFARRGPDRRGLARAAPTAAAGSAGEARRTCAPPDVHRLGRRRRLRRRVPGRRAVCLPAARRDCPTSRRRRCSAPGIIGYRALRCAAVPPGGSAGHLRLRRSAHLTAQVALAQGLRVHVLTRGERNRRLAAELGADSVGAAADPPPEPLDGAVLFAPAGELVPVALRALDRGATLAVAGIWLSRHPGAGLCRRAVPGAPAAQRHREHPRRRRGVPPPGRPARHPCHHGPLPHGRGGPPRSPTSPHGRFGGAAVLHN